MCEGLGVVVSRGDGGKALGILDKAVGELSRRFHRSDAREGLGVVVSRAWWRWENFRGFPIKRSRAQYTWEGSRSKIRIFKFPAEARAESERSYRSRAVT